MARLAITTKVHDRLVEAYDSGKFNVFVLEGSSRSSKTHSIIQFWIKYAAKHRGRQRRVAVCRLKGTWLSATVLKDFVDVLSSYGIYNPKDHNKTNKIIRLFDTEFWFIGLDDAQKIHGFASDAFWINEAIEAGYDDYTQLMQRCTGFAILDYNPSVEEHWVYDRILKRPKTWYSHSTFRDNQFISTNARDQILSYEPTEENYAAGTADERKWKIYGLGQRATLEGVIYSNWQMVQEVPAWAKKVRRYGLDFGYTNDPTAINDMYWTGNDNTLWVDEICYNTHMTNPEIGSLLIENNMRQVKGFADSAEPKSIDEIYKMGVNIHAVKKGAGSVINGIDILKRYKLNITERSINTIREIKNYTWAQDKNGKWLNVPVAVDDHSMDSIRYVGLMELGEQKSSGDRKKNTARALRALAR